MEARSTPPKPQLPNPRTGRQRLWSRLPQLLQFLALYLGVGVALGVFFASALVLANVAGLKDLLIEAQHPVLAIFLLYTFNALTFGSVSMGIGVMSLPFAEDDGAGTGTDTRPPGGS